MAIFSYQNKYKEEEKRAICSGIKNNFNKKNNYIFLKKKVPKNNVLNRVPLTKFKMLLQLEAILQNKIILFPITKTTKMEHGFFTS